MYGEHLSPFEKEHFLCKLSQCHACWCPGDWGRLNIIRHDINDEIWHYLNQCWLNTITSTPGVKGGGWGCEVSCGGHHRRRGNTTMGSALDGAVLDFTQILAYLIHNMSRSQLYLGFGHFGSLPSVFGQYHFGRFMVKLYFICWNYSLFWLTYYCSIGPCFSARF